MSPAVAQRHPCGYPWHARFPQAVRVLAGEGGAVYAAEDLGGRSLWVIKDESTPAGLVPEDGRNGLVTLTRYSYRDRAQWVADIVDMRRRHGAASTDADVTTWPGPLDVALVELTNETATRTEGLARRRRLKWVNERDHLQPCCAAAAAELAKRWMPAPTVSTQLELEFRAWPRVGSVDIALIWPNTAPVLLELKCGAGTDALGHCVWDSAKLALAMQYRKGSAVFLLAGAPASDWHRPVRGSEFFADGPHQAELLRVLYGDWWRHYERRDDPQPSELPRRWWTEHVHTAPFKVADERWELRLAQVLAHGEDRLPWPRLTASTHDPLTGDPR
jgi:hypothetical protein